MEDIGPRPYRSFPLERRIRSAGSRASGVTASGANDAPLKMYEGCTTFRATDGSRGLGGP